jgi:hypothetical protein
MEQREQVIKRAIDWIWLHTHCCAIKINLYHIYNPQTKDYKAEPKLLDFLKQIEFKWKNVINDSDGTQHQVLEVQNSGETVD